MQIPSSDPPHHHPSPTKQQTTRNPPSPLHTIDLHTPQLSIANPSFSFLPVTTCYFLWVVGWVHRLIQFFQSSLSQIVPEERQDNMPQHEHMERHRKLHGRRFDAEDRERKREARMVHKRSEFAQKVHGIRAKLYNQRRFKEKATMRKTIAQHNERSNKHANDDAVADGAVPAYLLVREGVSRAKVLSNTVKQKR